MIACVPILASIVLTNAAAVINGLRAADFGTKFEITAAVTLSGGNVTNGVYIGTSDGTGEICFSQRVFQNRIVLPSPGDRVRILGTIKPSDPYQNPRPIISSLEILSHGNAPKPMRIPARELLEGRNLNRLVAVRGTLIDSFRDEIDTRVFFLGLNCDHETIYAHVESNKDISNRLRELNGAEVEVVGFCNISGRFCYRRLSGYLLAAFSLDNVRVLRESGDLFNSPELRLNEIQTPNEVLKTGRCRTTGKVLAVWQHKALIRTAQNRVVNVDIAESQPLPACGQCIEAVGFAETDLYNISLAHGIWRPATSCTNIGEIAQKDLPIPALFTNDKGDFRIDPRNHGVLVRTTGTVKGLSRDGTFEIGCGDFTIPVDASTTPSVLNDISVGCEVAVTGVCVMNADIWRPYAVFPHIRGLTLVLRSPSDLKILSTPSWWTSERLLAAVCVLLVILIGFSVWNRFLSRLVERRSRQLAKEEIAHAATDLRAEERTRLSVELHDTIAQNLTGVSLQLDSVQLAAENEPELLFSCIDATRSSLNSCRQNLRDCLWDLRSRAFEEKTLAAAITRTLEPHKGSAEIVLDCAIRTQNCSDNAIHAILCIIRELTVNAIRHGQATRISIRGERRAGGLSFVVTDNGCGFDPDKAPGMDQGHFGLQGVRERVHRLKGTVSIASETGRGTTVELKDLSTDI